MVGSNSNSRPPGAAASAVSRSAIPSRSASSLALSRYQQENEQHQLDVLTEQLVAAVTSPSQQPSRYSRYATQQTGNRSNGGILSHWTLATPDPAASNYNFDSTPSTPSSSASAAVSAEPRNVGSTATFDEFELGGEPVLGMGIGRMIGDGGLGGFVSPDLGSLDLSLEVSTSCWR